MNVAIFLRRRKVAILLPFFVCLVLSVALAVTVDSVYESSATILIERQLSPKDFLAPSMGGLLEDRFQSITKIVLSRKNLEEVINDLDVYPELKDSVSPLRLVDKMLSDVTIRQFKENEGMMSMSMGRLPSSSLTFTLSFRSTDPNKTVKVVQTLAALFLSENLQTRESKALTRYTFLSEQLDDLQQQIAETEKRIAEFKGENLMSLPELMAANMKAQSDLQREIGIKQIQLTAARDRVIYLEGQLMGITPNQQSIMGTNGKILSLKDQLEALRSQYLNMKATHSDLHPDLVRLRHQIEALDQASGVSGKLQDLYTWLEDKETSRRLLVERFSSEHPDVQALDRDIASVRREIAALSSGGPKVSDDRKPEPDNPAFIQMLTTVESARLEVGSLTRTIEDLEKKQSDYNQRIEQMPQVEQEFLTIQRQYKYLLAQHQELYARQQVARENIDLEFQQIGETITMIEPPYVPEKPIKPNRPMLLILGLLFSVGLGLGLGIMAEYADHSIHTAQMLSELTGVYVLGSIPLIKGDNPNGGALKRRLGHGQKS